MKCPVCKKNISNSSIKCPYCKTRTGLLCGHCETVNPLGNVKCSNCGQDLLKICPKCNCVNFPTAVKCRKCGSGFKPVEIKEDEELVYKPELTSITESADLLVGAILSDEKKVISITGKKGLGKSTVFKDAKQRIGDENYQWCIGKCTQLTQLSPGGVVQDMLLNLFSLPNFSINNDDFKKKASDFFSKEFPFLKAPEIADFLNFIYNFNDGNYEDIIINKKKTYNILNKIFDAFAATGKFIFVVDNFDFIDGFSAEFFTNFIRKDQNWDNMKFIAIYNEYRPIGGFFGFEDKSLKAYQDINLKPIENIGNMKFTKNGDNYVSEREKEVILSRAEGNPAFIAQAYSYAFDCQINDKAFILPDKFADLIVARLELLKKSNKIAHKVLCAAAVLGDKINTNLIREIFGFKNVEFSDILQYLEIANYIVPCGDGYYEFNNLLLWETILKNITRDSEFDDINVKVGKAISIFNLNTNATMAMIAHNLKENRMAFDIWTKTTRLAAYVGDINLYVIAQKQCLALINEFKETETLNIRYNISEKLGKLLSEYDPEEALDFLPDAIANARENHNEVKEIELLGYLARCCNSTGNYFGNVECVDNVLKKLGEGQELERAMIISAKLSALLDIGNCGEVINLIDNDVLPVLNKHLSKPKLSKLFPLGLLFDSWLKVYLILADALARQGNCRAFDVLKNLFMIIDKHKINDKLLICRAKLVQAYANTMKGDFISSFSILEDLNTNYKKDVMDADTLSRWNLIYLINKFFKKEYDNLRNDLFNAVTFANNNGDNFTKHILKTLLGKLFKDENKAQQALGIYNEQVTYFAKEKMALGALLSWYLIADATIVTENSKSAVDVASQALEISHNPNIDNYFFAVCLRIVLAKAYMNLADFTTAKINIEEALKTAKKYRMEDMLSRIYALYGQYYFMLGEGAVPEQLEYLRGAAIMIERGLETVTKETKNTCVRNMLMTQKERLMQFCAQNNFKL